MRMDVVRSRAAGRLPPRKKVCVAWSVNVSTDLSQLASLVLDDVRTSSSPIFRELVTVA